MLFKKKWIRPVLKHLKLCTKDRFLALTHQALRRFKSFSGRLRLNYQIITYLGRCLRTALGTQGLSKMYSTQAQFSLGLARWVQWNRVQLEFSKFIFYSSKFIIEQRKGGFQSREHEFCWTKFVAECKTRKLGGHCNLKEPSMEREDNLESCGQIQEDENEYNTFKITKKDNIEI